MRAFVALMIFMVLAAAVSQAAHLSASQVREMYEAYGGLWAIAEEAPDTTVAFEELSEVVEPEIPLSVQRRVYVQGVFAGFFGKTHDDCPYEVEGWRILWFDGWSDGANYRRDLVGSGSVVFECEQ